MMRVLDLFSGIGGFSLGLERTGGFQTVAFCEIEEYPRAVLARHWPGVPIYGDVRELTADTLARDGIAVDVICGGFPCQDLSFAGKRAGLEGERSGLWREYARLVGEIRPRYVIVENVPGLLNLGMGAVLGDMASLGYNATWDCIPAAAVGAPHRRDRVWIIAHAHTATMQRRSIQRHESDRDLSCNGALADADKHAWHKGRACDTTKGPRRRDADRGGIEADVADAYSNHIDGRCGNVQVGRERCAGEVARDNDSAGIKRGSQSGLGGLADGFPGWLHEPDGLPRVAKGVPNRVGRLKALGNAVVPQVVEALGRAIMSAEESR